MKTPFRDQTLEQFRKENTEQREIIKKLTVAEKEAQDGITMHKTRAKKARDANLYDFVFLPVLFVATACFLGTLGALCYGHPVGKVLAPVIGACGGLALLVSFVAYLARRFD